MSNINNNNNLIFCYATCVGHLVRPNNSYTYFEAHISLNILLWVGNTKIHPHSRSSKMVKKSTLACKKCLSRPECVSPYPAMIYYSIHYMHYVNMVCNHLGQRKHLVAHGKCNEIVGEHHEEIGPRRSLMFP